MYRLLCTPKVQLDYGSTIQSNAPMKHNTWHYPRTELARQILDMFESGLSSALTFFAPRRMGKTEFLCHDIMPLAKKRGWQVFYFSFLDADKTAPAEFTKALLAFAQQNISLTNKTRGLFERISKVRGEALGIKAELTFDNHAHASRDLKEVMVELAKKGQLLLLMDEIQVLAQYPMHAHFVAALRTCLDIHKNTIKVIFTGSSQEGLRRMFSQARAPFFHFGQNLHFPELDRGFTDHLVRMFEIATKRKLETERLWNAFEEMQKVPQLIRALVERLALNPGLELEQAKQQLLSEVFSDRDFAKLWQDCAALERLLLREIAQNESSSLFGIETRNAFASILGVETLSVASVQSAMRTLQRKGLIGKNPGRRGFFIDDLNLKSWLLQISIGE